MAWKVDTSGARYLAARIQMTKRYIPNIMELAINTAAAGAVLELRNACPRDDELNNGVIPGEEGHLDESFVATEARTDGPNTIAQVKTEEPIKFSYVTQGTMDKSPIRPVYARGLWWPALPHPVAFVMGQEANPFQKNAKELVEQTGDGYFSEALTELAALLEE